MTIVRRVLPAEPYGTLADYAAAGGGAGLTAARAVSPAVVIDELAASGLRGRGGAGFPTGTKWRTIRSFASASERTSVVVNAAEGEPGTFKDRSILRANPYAVLEGALIAAHAMEADTVVVATKAIFTEELARMRAAIDEVAAAGWLAGIDIRIVEGPAHYLLGEETALLEVIDGRPPFPRIAPPFRRGIDEVAAPGQEEAPVETGSGLAASVQMADMTRASEAPPVLVNNVETMANVPAIIALGAEWFRSVGTEKSPGTVVCTVTGAVQHPGVAEVAMGTSLRDVIDAAGGGLLPDRHVLAVLIGVSSAPIGPDELDITLDYETLASIDSGLGSAGFIVIDDASNVVGTIAGVSRFLAVESCGQCTPCKQDGALVSTLLAKVAGGEASERDLATIDKRLSTVANGARCSLARQHQAVVGSLVEMFAATMKAQLGPGGPTVPVEVVAELVDIDGGGAYVDPTFAGKQLDWSFDATDSAKAPVDLYSDHRAHVPVD
jgi:NADH:ubiquinone oxidoreductase subunit F (NADH-binding)